MSEPSVSIVVCTRNRSSLLENALGDLIDQRVPEQFGEYEIVVVDDASTDDTPAVVERIARGSKVVIRRLAANGTGVAHARNVGVLAAHGRWVAFFDDDQRTDPAWLAELLEAARRTGADMVGGPIEVSLPDGIDVGPVVRAIYGEHPTQRQRMRGITPRPGGGNRLVHRRVFERVGLHDEALIACEDTDLVARAEHAHMAFGWAPSAVVRHLIPEERLDPGTIAAYSKRAGAGRAWVDYKAKGRRGIAVSSATVLTKAGANAVLTLVAMFRRSRVDVLDCRTRTWVFSGYLAKAVRAMVSGDPTL